ncbi:hypothetical protein II582_04795 [bacterium]|nr:hypothetical protein [bacterium]
MIVITHVAVPFAHDVATKVILSQFTVQDHIEELEFVFKLADKAQFPQFHSVALLNVFQFTVFHVQTEFTVTLSAVGATLLNVYVAVALL